MRRTRTAVAVAVLTLAPAGAALGAFGSPDTSFGSGGQAFSRVPWAGLDVPTAPPILGLRILSDGRLEYLTTGGDGSRTVLTRVRRRPGGAISHSVRIPVRAGSFTPRYAAQVGAGYVVLGQMSTVAGLQSFLVKVTASGARDSTFGSNGVVALPTGANFYDTIAVGTRGQVAVGLVTNGSTTTSSRVLMLRPNGSRDTAFGSNGVFSFPAVGADVRISRIRFMGDGRLYVLYTPENDSTQLVRLTATGRRDTTYSGDGTADRPAVSPLVLQDFALVGSGKVVVIGSQAVNPSPAVTYRVNADGRVDGTFAGGSIVRSFPWPSTFVSGETIARRPDGRLVLVGSAPGMGVWIARTDANGVGDQMRFVFATTTQRPTEGVAVDAAQIHIPTSPTSDGAIQTVADTDVSASFATVTQATYAGSYRAGTSFPQIAADPTGRVLVAGTEANGITMGMLTARGAQDTNFGPSVTRGGSRIEAPGLSDSTTRIVRFATGNFAVLNAGRVHLVTPFGTPVSGFGTDGAVTFPNHVGDIERLPDGKYLVAHGSGDSILLDRLNANGTPDTTFGTNGSAAAVVAPGQFTAVLDLSVSSAGYLVATRVLVDGAAVVRFRTDGTLDPAVGTAGVLRLAGGNYLAAAADRSGRLILVGKTTSATVRRLTSSMVPDPTFSGDGLMTYGDRVTGVAVVPDGSLVIDARRLFADRVAHLDVTGRVIAERVVGTGLAGQVQLMADGRLLAAPWYLPQDSAVIRLKGVQPLRATSPRRMNRATFRAKVLTRGLRSTTMTVQALRSGRWVSVGRRAVPALVGRQLLGVRTSARSTDHRFRVLIGNASGIAIGGVFRG